MIKTKCLGRGVAVLVSLLLSAGLSVCLTACGENKSSDAPQTPTGNLQLPPGPPDLVESFILEDLAGQPSITFVEFSGVTIVTVRDADGARTESLLIKIDPQNKRTIQRSRLGEDWAKPFGKVEPSRILAEFKAFQFYLKSMNYSQLQDCRSSKAWKPAVDSIRRNQDPVLFSIQALRKFKNLIYEAVFEIDIQTSRIVGITVDRGADAVLTDAAYLAMEPHWVLDGRPSHTLLGTLESFEFDLRCRTNRTERSYRRGDKSETKSVEAIDQELSRFVDADMTFRPRLKSVYQILTRRREIEVGRISENTELLRHKASPSEINEFFSTTRP